MPHVVCGCLKCSMVWLNNPSCPGPPIPKLDKVCGKDWSVWALLLQLPASIQDFCTSWQEPENEPESLHQLFKHVRALNSEIWPIQDSPKGCVEAEEHILVKTASLSCTALLREEQHSMRCIKLVTLCFCFLLWLAMLVASGVFKQILCRMAITSFKSLYKQFNLMLLYK